MLVKKETDHSRRSCAYQVMRDLLLAAASIFALLLIIAGGYNLEV